MRRFHAFLLSAGLVAAPAGAVAKPSDSSGPEDTVVERFEWSASKGRLGVMVMSLSPELRAHFGSTDGTGVLIARVEPGSPAARAGLAVGDVLVDVRGTKVDDAGDVITALRSDDKKPVRVRVLRDKKSMTFDVTLDGKPTTTSRLQGWPNMDWLRDMFELPDHRTPST